MHESLCNFCGKRLNETMRICPDCGALNPNNINVVAAYQSQIVQESRATKKIINGFSIVGLVVGVVLFIAHIVMLVSDAFAPFSFVGAVGGGMVVAFGIISLNKKEATGKAMLIAIGVSLWILIMQIFLNF